MTKSFGRSVLACAVLVVAPAAVVAQSAQTYSLQASGLLAATTLGADQQTGFGAEGQFRFNHLSSSSSGALSLGIGAQYTLHSFEEGDFNIVGAFLEPRYAFAVASERFFPYVAGRLALLQHSGTILESSIGYAVGGGGGLAVALGPKVNLDLGVAALLQGFGDAPYLKGANKGKIVTTPASFGYAVKLGLSFGL